MKVKQYNIKVFEVEIKDKVEFIDFVEKNHLLLKKYLLYLKGEVTKEIADVLKKYNISYTQDLSIEANTKEVPLSSSNELKIVDNIVRSGQEIVTKSDILVLNRINSGAIVKSEGNFISLSLIDGKVECNGEFMLIKASKKATIIFNYVDISSNVNDGSFYKVQLKEEKIIISKYKKDFKWA